MWTPETPEIDESNAPFTLKNRADHTDRIEPSQDSVATAYFVDSVDYIA
jgi:hypothetical protein